MVSYTSHFINLLSSVAVHLIKIIYESYKLLPCFLFPVLPYCLHFQFLRLIFRNVSWKPGGGLLYFEGDRSVEGVRSLLRGNSINRVLQLSFRRGEKVEEVPRGLLCEIEKRSSGWLALALINSLTTRYRRLPFKLTKIIRVFSRQISI